MNPDKGKSLVVGLVIGAIVALSSVFAVNLLAGSSTPVSQNNRMAGATGVPSRFPHDYLDTGFGYYVSGVTVIDSSRNGTFTTLGGTAEAQTAVATSTLSASSVCGDSFLSITPVSTTPTITLPSTTTLFASCLGTAGQYRDIVYKAITTSTILAAGSGGTILNSSSLTIAAGKGAVLRFIHDTTAAGGTYIVALLNLLN